MSSIAATLPAEARSSMLAGAALARRGYARVEIGRGEAGDRSRIVAAESRSPLRVLMPRNHGRGAWAYFCALGGGLLGGDELEIDIKAGLGSVSFLGTQSSTKVFRSAGASPTRQNLRAHVADDALLMLLPDPVTCFADAHYVQRQRFDVHAQASVAILDWFTSGRHARGERWQAAHYAGSNELWRNGKCILRDRLQLSPGGNALGMGYFNCVATLILNGPRLAPASAALLEEFQRSPVIPRAATPFGVSPLGDGLILRRVAGPDAEAVARFIFPRLEFLADILGDCPWRRKW